MRHYESKRYEAAKTVMQRHTVGPCLRQHGGKVDGLGFHFALWALANGAGIVMLSGWEMSRGDWHFEIWTPASKSNSWADVDAALGEPV